MDCDHDNEVYHDTIRGLEGEPEGGARCSKCYYLRLDKTAQLASENKFDYFATTLTVSPLKNSEKLNSIGEHLSKIYNIKYLYSDFKKKEGYKTSIILSKKYNQLYELYLNKLGVLESIFSKENNAPYGNPVCQSRIVETDGLNEQHSGVMNAFAGAILRDEPLVADGREGINALMISNAMHLSAWLGKEVEIPFDEFQFKELLEERVKESKKKENVKYVFSEFDKNHGNLHFT